MNTHLPGSWIGRLRHTLVAAAALFATMSIWAQSTPLPPEQAFRVQLRQTGERTLEARFDVAPGHYLYRDRLGFAASSASLQLQARRPAGTLKNDPAFGQVEVYPHAVSIPLIASQPLPPGVSITLQYQGCADSGLCYAAQSIALRPGESTQTSRPVELLQTLAPTPPTEHSAAAPVARPALIGTHLPTTLALFFIAGLGLAFTACMYPLLPIVSGIVLRGIPHGRKRAPLLCLTYVQGMALTYTGAGLLAATSGAFLAVTLQQPWIIAGFALFFVAMALAMFGVFSLQLPSLWQSHINHWANRFPGGRYIPVFIMGALSALIVGPCIAPPLAAALVYLGQSGDILQGGLALYALAMGLGTPLMAIGLLGATALPRLSSHLQHSIRVSFGIVLLGMAIWIARPLWQTNTPVAGLKFQSVANHAELDSALRQARGKPVLLDIYADWCASCVTFEKNTLTAPDIQARLAGFVLLRADITANRDEHHALLRQLGLYGPPALIFFDRRGKSASPIMGAPERGAFLSAIAQAAASQ